MARTREASYVLQVLTTEHFALQTARAATVAEANGRTSLFMNAVAASVIATAFIGQAAPMGISLRGFILVVAPVVVVLGIVTFVRLLDTSMYDMSYALRISRLRHFYRELVPEYGELLATSVTEDPAALPGILGGPFWWRSLVSSAGVVEVITSVLLAMFAGVGTESVALGGAVFVLTLTAHLVYQVARWRLARELK